MQTQNRFLDDLARVATGTLGVASGMRQEVETRLRSQFERVLAGMDLVSREEFEVVKAMAVKARQSQEDLELKLAALEKRLAEGSTGGGAPVKKTKTAKKAAAKASAKSGPSV